MYYPIHRLDLTKVSHIMDQNEELLKLYLITLLNLKNRYSEIDHHEDKKTT
jgi:hypothetical protein